MSSAEAEQKLSQRLLTIKEAGSYIALGPCRIRSLIYRGELPYIRLGRRILIELKDLDALIDSKKHEECIEEKGKRAVRSGEY
jgi:excisionase family DNA binding protein